MNRNRKIKTAAVALSAGVIISSAPVTNASPLAGAVASMYNVNETILADQSSLSGTTLALSAIMEETTGEVAPIVTEITPLGEVLAPVQVSQEEILETEDSDEKTEGEFSNIAIAQVNDYVNIRSEASEDGELVGKLYAKGAATVQENLGEWVHITSGNAEGYIKAEYLEIGNEELCLENSKIVAKVQTDGLNVREAENTESSILKRMGEGDRLNVAETPADSDEWVRVSLDDSEGFVSAEFVEVGRVYSSVAETKAEEEARLEAERKEAQKKAAKGGGSGSGGYVPPAGSGGQSVANFACQFIGNPYVYGGSSLTGGADCSGFVMAVYSNFGIGLPHSSGAMRGVGYGVPVDQMAPGDIVCYSGHVGIYIGGGQIVNASTPATGIKTQSAFYKNIITVRRLM